MKIETIVVLVLTAIAIASLVWVEMKSRRNSPATPLTTPAEQSPEAPVVSRPFKRTRRR
jgi:hypothetical protein